ncbi:RING-H2 finger protein ATL73 [Striga hermonthica]|uniref:RING-type E3 ubiquitin transferase n=1 Tax=Striga hermonthica TaxID=68872 RepID=A0A9N7N803_STRHE|nr:RING-H2 finger protein ATL73 [Striga hermonthica]
MNFNHRTRRLLPDARPGVTPSPPQTDSGDRSHDDGRAANFDTNMVIILAALLCALICALGINSIVRCVLRCAGESSSAAPGDPPLRFGQRGLRKSLLRQIHYRWRCTPPPAATGWLRRPSPSAQYAWASLPTGRRLEFCRAPVTASTSTVWTCGCHRTLRAPRAANRWRRNRGTPAAAAGRRAEEGQRRVLPFGLGSGAGSHLLLGLRQFRGLGLG